MKRKDFLIENGCLKQYFGRSACVRIPDGVREIGRGAFKACTRVTEVEMSDEVTRIGAHAFSGCQRLCRVRLSERLTAIGTGAFLSCDALEDINVPAAFSQKPYSWWEERFGGVRAMQIGFEHPNACPKLLSHIKREWRAAFLMILARERTDWLCLLLSLRRPRVPFEHLREMLAGAEERGCGEMIAELLAYRREHYSERELAHIEQVRVKRAMGLLPLTVEDWRLLFEYEVDELGEITLCRYIGEEETVLIPRTIGRRRVTALRAGVFRGSAVRMIAVEPDSEACYVEGYALYDRRKRSLLKYFGEEETVTVPNGVREIADAAFLSCRKIVTVHLPPSLRRIGDSAFFHCPSLSRAVIPEGVTEIGFSAFRECTALTEASLPSTLRRLGNYAFAACESLEELSIPAGLETVAAFSFMKCTRLRTLRIEDGTVSIGTRAFARCMLLEHVVLPESVQFIGNLAFEGCRMIRKLVLPRSIRRLGTEILGWISDFSGEIHFAGTAQEWRQVDSDPYFSRRVTCDADGTVIEPRGEE